jgi:hypothetical protein
MSAAALNFLQAPHECEHKALPHVSESSLAQEPSVYKATKDILGHVCAQEMMREITLESASCQSALLSALLDLPATCFK